MKNKTLNLLILNLIIMVLIWSVYFYIIHDTKLTSASFEQKKHEISFAMKKEQAIKNLKNKIQSNLKDGFDLKDFLVRSDQAADVVQLIEGFGPLTGTKVLTQSVSTEEAVGLPEGADFLRIVFNIEGSRSSVLKNIELVESLPYNIKMKKLSFAKSGDASSTSKWSAGVDLVLVKLKDVEAVTNQ
ncbi:MAG: hypothetical protein WCO16_03275 [bacterium]